MWSLLAALTISLVSSSQGANYCHSCISDKSVISQWYLFGLPTQSTFPKIDQYCNDPPTAPSQDKPKCDGPCFSILIKDKNSVIYAVRGCSQNFGLPVSNRLSQSTTNNNNNNKNDIYCEYDAHFKRPVVSDQNEISSAGNEMYFELCNGDFCNSNKYSGANIDISKCNSNTTMSNNAASECYECDGTDYNCKSSKTRCGKRYCLKSEVSIGKMYSIRKTCTNVNPYGVDEYCGEYDYSFVAGGMSTLDAKMKTCYCRDKQYCNGASVVTILFAVVVPVLATLMR
ncbi:hypothetical protein QR680_010704 [Steinernema hermaphroditum]|uniref:UPAR/Ly6 domain-containing protein n=1 Tax=Steinernema hermaphroditum TaxID=289476 RepID=A0AA39IPV6_9BILA|nr:hypothetical protein QR680_010704 [Steinernema hermaphroditum]